MQRVKWFSTLVMGCALAASADAALADLLQLVPSRDNTIYSDRTSNSNGQGVDIGTGVTDSGGIRRALLHFDVSSLPDGSRIHSVNLTLHLVHVGSGDVLARNTAVYRALASWGEGKSNASGGGGGGGGGGQGAAAQTGDATWLRGLFDTVSWTTPGGDFAAASSAITSVGTDLVAYHWTGAGLVADVQGWVDGTFANHGWLLRGEETLSTIRRFGSLQNSNADLRPLLTVVYTVPEPTSAVLAMLAISGYVVSVRRQRRKPSN